MRFGYFLLILALAVSIAGQTTEFTYQGSLRDGANAATGNYDFEFRIYDASSGGSQFGSTLTRSGVSVSNGIFSVPLDFGFTFPGPDRYLDIRVRGAGGGAFTTLDPRQKITTAPYAIRSVSSESSNEAQTAATANNALALGGIAASQFVVTTDPRMTNDRPPTPGSSNYIQNGGTPQTAAFNISGFGTAGNLNSLNDYFINGTRVMSNAGSLNMFVGAASGGNTTGTANAFFGASSGSNNLSGENNSFFGASSGFKNTTGNSNAFFGRSAGEQNTTGGGNTFIGTYNGDKNTTGNSNTFVGFSAGRLNTNGSNNAFFGTAAGLVNLGSDNSFFGSEAGLANSTGQENSFFGRLAGAANTSGGDNAFFGAYAGQSNTNGSFNSFFGWGSGNSNTTGRQNTFVGRSSGEESTTGNGNSFFGDKSGDKNTTGFGNTIVGAKSSSISEGNTTGSNNTLLGYNANVGSGNLNFATAIGADAVVSISNSVVLGRTNDTVRVPGILSVTGGTDVEPGFGGYIVAGTNTGTNVTIDDNEIMARNGGAATTLFLNADGGDVNLISTGTGNVGIAIAGTPQDKLHVDGIIRVTTLGSAGGTSLCRNASGQISTCSSSLRYKTNFSMYRPGLDLISRLKPIAFDWKDGGMHDLGLGAEDVAAIEPLLVTYNARGEVEGVKYDRIGVVLVNAVKEQQKQIEGLKTIVCEMKPSSPVCHE